MTALRRRRRRRTLIGFGVTVVLLVTASILTVVGVVTLSNSEEGRAVEQDDRPVVVLPGTPNAAVAVVDDEGRLASLVVATLRPEGIGGSIVTVPVNADVNGGFGEERVRYDGVFDSDEPDGSRSTLEAMLSLTIERFEVVDEDGVADLIEPVTPAEVYLPDDVVDSDAVGTGIVAGAGERTLRASVAAEALAAIDESGDSYDHHDLDVAIWSGLAAEAPVPGPGPELGELGRPVAPASVEELFARLWTGPVEVRDLSIIDGEGADGSDGESVDDDDGVGADADGTDAESAVDAVVLDRRDVLLVFAQVSPGLVSTPNQALSFRIEACFDDEQIEASDGLFESTSELTRELIGELLFFQGNIVSVDTSPCEGGAPEVSQVEVSQERFLEDVIFFSSLVFGESEVVVADTLIDGVDVTVRLGTDYIATKLES